MTIIEALILMISVGLMNVLCFLIGAKTGQKASKGEDITLPNLNPIEAVREYEETKQQKKEDDNYNTMLENIEAYDGTSIGQKDFI